MMTARLPSRNAGARLPLGVLDVADVAHADRRAVRVATTMLPNSLGRLDPSERAQHQLRVALLDAAAGHLDVLGDDRVTDLRPRQAVRVQLLDVEDDVDFARAAAGRS